MKRFLARLTPRERVVVLGGAAVATLFFLVAYVFVPLVERHEVLDRGIRQQSEALTELAALRGEYLALKGRVDTQAARLARQQDFSLLSFLEETALRFQLRQHIAYMKPRFSPIDDQRREVAVEMKLENVALRQAIRYLASLEESPYLIWTKRLQIKKRFADPHLLDVILVVATYERV